MSVVEQAKSFCYIFCPSSVKIFLTKDNILSHYITGFLILVKSFSVKDLSFIYLFILPVTNFLNKFILLKTDYTLGLNSVNMQQWTCWSSDMTLLKLFLHIFPLERGPIVKWICVECNIIFCVCWKIMVFHFLLHNGYFNYGNKRPPAWFVRLLSPSFFFFFSFRYYSDISDTAISGIIKCMFKELLVWFDLLAYIR